MEKIVNFTNMKKKMMEENIRFESKNDIFEYEGCMRTSFWAELTKTIYNDNENNEDTEVNKEVLLKVEDGIVIPSILEFEEVDTFGSVMDFCDSIDGDILGAYETIADIEEGIKCEFIKELGLQESAAFESSILYIWNIDVKKEEYLDLFLTLFDDFLVQMPSRYSEIAVVLINKVQQPKYIDIFKKNSWRIKAIDENCGIAYRKI